MSDRIILVLEPLEHDVPPEVRLRMALKTLLRQYFFRCVKVENTPPPPEPDEETS
jgi:hypothetical protein